MWQIVFELFVQSITLSTCNTYNICACVVCCQRQENLSVHLLQEGLTASAGCAGAPAGRAADQVKLNAATAHMQAATQHLP